MIQVIEKKERENEKTHFEFFFFIILLKRKTGKRATIQWMDKSTRSSFVFKM